MHETFKQVIPIDFHETYDFKDLYGFQLENFARSEITNVLNVPICSSMVYVFQ